jgi:tetratricopeptide (TPR) repeat protein
MAKRKRKSSGGGAFGKSGARRLPEIEPKIGEDEGLEVDRNRPSADQERRIAVATRQMAWLKERSEEERTELADALFNLSPEAFFERYDPEPEAHFRATKHLEEGIDNEEDDEGMRKRVIEALAIDPDCVDAHLLLAEMSRDAESKLGHCQDAVAAGERKHQAVLAAAGDDPVDPALELLDRPYLEALHDLANYRWMNADREGSRECYQRMLDLEPKDFHDVISALIALAFAADDLDEVSRFLDAASIQGSTSVLFGRALRAFRIAMEEFPDFMPDMTSPEPFAALQSPGMRIARELLSHAIQSAPWAVSFVLDPRVLVLRPVMSYSIGDPFDALEFARLNFLNWTLKVLPAVWLITEFGGSPPTQATERRLRQHHLAFSEARDLLDEIECPDLGGDEILEFARQFSDIAEDIGGLLEERGESPKGRRFRR